MRGKIVYRFETPAYPGKILYINLIKNYSCVNDCRFCGRPRSKKDVGKPNIYEKKANSFLYLEKSPTEKEVLAEVEKEIKKDDQEIAFIGLGEPLIYLDKILEITKELKIKYPEIKVRADTNAATQDINKNPVKVAKDLERSGIDEIRISLNAINQKEYNDLCRPSFNDAFNKIKEFIKALNKTKIKTCVSFVVGFQDEKVKTRSKKDYLEFAQSLGINKKNVNRRDYINIDQNGNSKGV